MPSTSKYITYIHIIKKINFIKIYQEIFIENPQLFKLIRSSSPYLTIDS